jgi:hypothetical protein
VAVEIPERIEQAVDDAVAHHLATGLGDRGLLLTAADLAVAEAQAAALGQRLLTRVLHQCYPMIRDAGDDAALEFERSSDVARIGATLTFGAVTSTVLAARQGDRERLPGCVELLCATFNLGIGLIDGVCDGDAESGERLLTHLHGADLFGAAADNRGPGWLRRGLPGPLAADPAMAFTVDIIEAFFQTLHVVYPDATGAHVRRRVGGQLIRALASESQSVGRGLVGSSREGLIECSRATSVLPFQIIETLALGGPTSTTPSAGTLLGEAMWRIDDLVDLCDDARCGALNSVLVAASGVDAAQRAGGQRYRLVDLERLLASSDIASAAAAGAESLRAGLQLAGEVTAPDRIAFLRFIQMYTAIPPRDAS